MATSREVGIAHLLNHGNLSGDDQEGVLVWLKTTSLTTKKQKKVGKILH